MNKPTCTASRHSWKSPHSVVGGIKENPGVWSLGGTKMSFSYVCCHCGAYKTEKHAGAQRHPDEPAVSVTYKNPDETSLAYCRRLAD